jgi:hypothetical protein
MLKILAFSLAASSALADPLQIDNFSSGLDPVPLSGTPASSTQTGSMLFNQRFTTFKDDVAFNPATDSGSLSISGNMLSVSGSDNTYTDTLLQYIKQEGQVAADFTSGGANALDIDVDYITGKPNDAFDIIVIAYTDLGDYAIAQASLAQSSTMQHVVMPFQHDANNSRSFTTRLGTMNFSSVFALYVTIRSHGIGAASYAISLITCQSPGVIH